MLMTQFSKVNFMSRGRNLLPILLVISLSAVAQQPSSLDRNNGAPQVVDKNLHEKAKELVDLMGVRQRMQDNLDKSLQEGKENVQRQHPGWDPAFSEEWLKRMRARTNIDDYVDVVIRVYEKHINTEEIEALIVAQRDLNESKAPSLAPALKGKLSAMAVTLQSEIMGGCTEVGAKLGGEIGKEISAEHPEWVKEPKPTEQPKTGK